HPETLRLQPRYRSRARVRAAHALATAGHVQSPVVPIRWPRVSAHDGGLRQPHAVARNCQQACEELHLRLPGRRDRAEARTGNARRGIVEAQARGPGMRALLFQPPVYDTQYFPDWSQPSGLLKVSTWLRKDLGYDVRLFDCLF